MGTRSLSCTMEGEPSLDQETAMGEGLKLKHGQSLAQMHNTNCLHDALIVAWAAGVDGAPQGPSTLA